MRILLNANRLLQCNYSLGLKSSRNFRWYLSTGPNAAAAATHFPNCNIHLNTEKFSNTNRKLGAFFPPHLSRSIATTRIRSATETQPPPPPATDEHPDGETIYTGKFTRQIIRVKMFSLTTSAMGLVAQPVLWQKGLEVSGTGLSVLICSVAGLFIFVTPVLLHLVTKKYVIDIKYNKKTDEYTCMTVSFFLFQNTTKFKVEDIVVPEIETMFSSMLIGSKKQPVFVDANSFTDTHHYARFMGYDKPLAFRLDPNANEPTTKFESADDSSRKEESTQSSKK